jgi:hypothetical protein
MISDEMNTRMSADEEYGSAVRKVVGYAISNLHSITMTESMKEVFIASAINSGVASDLLLIDPTQLASHLNERVPVNNHNPALPTPEYVPQSRAHSVHQAAPPPSVTQAA